MSPGSRPKKRLCVSLLTAESFSKGCYPAKAGSEKERSGFSLSPDGVEGRILRKLAYGRVFFEGLLSGESRQREEAKRIRAGPDGAEGRYLRKLAYGRGFFEGTLSGESRTARRSEADSS